MDTAKVFMNGRSQAVRLPYAYRFKDDEVAIRREGEAVILEPIKKREWPRGLWKRIRIADAGFERPPQGTTPPISSLDSSDS